MISQIFILILAVIAARVAWLLAHQQIAWKWVLSYWIVLTAKNIADFAINQLTK